MPRQVHFVLVGACAIDTILTVPHFPAQDTKLRASDLSRRRGGNCPNTLEVLKQLIQYETTRLQIKNASLQPGSRVQIDLPPELNLIATFPSRSSQGTDFMMTSLRLEPLSMQFKTAPGEEETIITSDPVLNFSRCVYREEHSDPVSSYIISDVSTSSRTIINHNVLPEMTIAECIERFDDIISPVINTQHCQPEEDEHEFWFHFEGRILDVILEGIRHLRKSLQNNNTVSLNVSVELEKPGRKGLQELVEEADLIFYSRSWAEYQGYQSADDCVRSQALMMSNATNANLVRITQHSSSDKDSSVTQPKDRTFICTWGASGACATTQSSLATVNSPGYRDLERRVVDTTGAGDTFIAGILFAFAYRHGRWGPTGSGMSVPGSEEHASDRSEWSLRERLDFANELAGRKVLQIGFAGLAKVMQESILKLDEGQQLP